MAINTFKASCFCLYQLVNMWQYSGNICSLSNICIINAVNLYVYPYHHRILLPSTVSRLMYHITSVLVAHTRYKQYWDLLIMRQIASVIPVSYGLCFQRYRLFSFVQTQLDSRLTDKETFITVRLVFSSFLELHISTFIS